MQDELLRYYNDELTYVRQLGNQFARDFPQVASKLALEQDACNDPHVERLLEGFAFLAARVRKKIDDQFPEITEALLNVIYPHFLRPVPSFTVVQFELDPRQGKLETGLNIDRHTVLESRPVAANRSSRENPRETNSRETQERSKFRTVYPTTLWPITVTSAEWTTPDRIKGLQSSTASEEIREPLRKSVAAIRVQLECASDVLFSQLEMDDLCFYLDGERRLIYKLYELLCSRLQGIIVRDPTSTSGIDLHQLLPASAVRPMGFAEDEGALPYPGRSFVAYRLLQEYFSFPEKFFFVNLRGLQQVWNPENPRSKRVGARAEIIFLVSAFEGTEYREAMQMGIGPETFRVGCTPVINLFPHVAETILVDHTKHEYPVVPDSRRQQSFEVFSIDDVYGTTRQGRETIHYEPFFAFRHTADLKRQEAFWVANRRPSLAAEDNGTDMAISLLDMSMNHLNSDVDSLDVRATCTNRDLPARLPFRIGKEALDKDVDRDRGDLQLEGTSAVARIIILTKPTPTRRVSLGPDSHWRLISHLSLNYLSLLEDEGRALKQMLMIYNFDRNSVLEKHIAGIARLKSTREFAAVTTDDGITFARGVRVDIEFNEDEFVGGGVYLFASVLENFLGLYASLNSFTRLRATTTQRKEVLHEWSPRAGQRVLA